MDKLLLAEAHFQWANDREKIRHGRVTIRRLRDEIAQDKLIIASLGEELKSIKGHAGRQHLEIRERDAIIKILYEKIGRKVFTPCLPANPPK